MNKPEIQDYRKLALEAAMKIPYQTHSELLISCDKIYNWLVQDKIRVSPDFEEIAKMLNEH